MDLIKEICEKHGALLVEDALEAMVRPLTANNVVLSETILQSAATAIKLSLVLLAVVC